MYQNVSGEVLFFVVFKNAYLQRCFVACLRFCKMISTTIAQSSIRLCNMLPHSLCPILCSEMGRVGSGPNVSSFGQLLEAFEPFVLTRSI